MNIERLTGAIPGGERLPLAALLERIKAPLADYLRSLTPQDLDTIEQFVFLYVAPGSIKFIEGDAATAIAQEMDALIVMEPGPERQALGQKIAKHIERASE